VQGDVLLAEKLTQVLTRPDGRCALVATFIHRVVPALETISSLRSRRSNKAAWLAAWRDQNIFFNRTHVGMAVQVLCFLFKERLLLLASQIGFLGLQCFPLMGHPGCNAVYSEAVNVRIRRW
jgi:hypothetical protein